MSRAADHALQIEPPELHRQEGRYVLRFAQSEADLDAIYRLRFEVFNLELKEGLEESYQTGRDTDEFDRQCHHLMVIEAKTGKVVGTYRLQTGEMARAGVGFYSATEFDLGGLPEEVIESSVEVGRACIAKDHRNHRVLFLLWKGLAAYFSGMKKLFFFGCCSLTSQDPEEGTRVLAWLRARDLLWDHFTVQPMPGYECVAEEPQGELPEVKIPTLFGTYLRYGAKLCGPPAIDRQFGTIDFLALLDVRLVDPKVLTGFLN